jgi:hypothetical protein
MADYFNCEENESSTSFSSSDETEGNYSIAEGGSQNQRECSANNADYFAGTAERVGDSSTEIEDATRECSANSAVDFAGTAESVGDSSTEI